MSSQELPQSWAKGTTVRVAWALTLALAAFLAVLTLSANTARAPVTHLPRSAARVLTHSVSMPGVQVADEIDVPIGPLCFFQHGYPTCVARGDAIISTDRDAITPEALLTALLAGPTPDEQTQGFESAIPSGAQLAAVATDGRAITVQLALPTDFIDAQGSEAIVQQVVQTLLPFGYRDFYIEAENPSAPGTFRPLSAYLPEITIPPKVPNIQYPIPNTQPPVESPNHPQGALSGKTVYVSAGHGWQYSSGWRTQRPPYPDATTGYYGPIIEDHNNAEVVNQYLLRYLENAGADVWSAREHDLNSFESIADESSSARVGQWTTVSTGGYGSDYLQISTALAATAAVTWTIDPSAADGEYALYVWYTPGADRAPDAHYTIHHAGGATELTVDQRHHGQTWRYVGRFAVRAGESLTVVLDNRSDTPGAVVVADALRLGGGWFDNSDLGYLVTQATYAPDKPWFEVAAYYNVQRLGIDPDDFADFNDVIARPLWARWEHANTGDDAVFISWHTNGYNGHNETYWGTSSYIHSYQAVDGSADLRHAVHSELVNDARAGWDPAWRDRGQGSMDLGELRELWDDDTANAIPGVLLEVAYHDHVGDTNALKDPRFALLSARAVYQGIVKYYEGRDGVELTLLPEPPTHLTVRNSGPGQVTVNWQPSPTDGVGLVGDPAESYRVYTSRDGLGWDNGAPVTGTTFALTGLQDFELVFVRVTAVNAGGESFPTPALAARVSPEGVGRVLLVDGFDRIDRHALIIENDPVEGTNARMFIDQINTYDYAIEHGTAIAFPFDSALNEAVRDGDLSPSLYDILDWFVGEESSADDTFDAAEQAVLSAYLKGGGGLFVSGAEVGWDLVYLGDGPDFHRNDLGADYAGDDSGTYWATPASGGIFDGLGTIFFDANYDADYPDQLTPLGGSIATLEYLGGVGGTAAIQYDAGNCQRVVYFGFPFETIDASQRADVMDRVMDYLSADGCLAVTPQTAITSPVNGAAVNVMPHFGGTSAGTAPIARVDVQISDPGGRYWNGQDWVASSQWLTAVGAPDWSYPFSPTVLSGTLSIALLEQGEYQLSARAWDTDALSDTTPAHSSFIFDTISPTAPTLVAPANGITLTSALFAFQWTGLLSDTGSSLGYHLQIDDWHVTQTHPQYTNTRLFPTGVHTWRVRTLDAAGNRSAWTPVWSFYAENKTMYLPFVLRDLPDETLACQGACGQ